MLSRAYSTNSVLVPRTPKTHHIACPPQIAALSLFNQAPPTKKDGSLPCAAYVIELMDLLADQSS